MTVRFHITCVACLVLVLGGASQLRAQFDLYVAHVADGGGYFTQVSVHNPGINTAACTFSTFDGQGNPLNLVYGTAAANSTAAVHHRSHAIPAATAAPASSVQFSVDPLGTFTMETTGGSDAVCSGWRGPRRFSRFGLGRLFPHGCLQMASQRHIVS